MNGAATAIRRRALSSPARWLRSSGLLLGKVLDYGCGLGDDARLLGCEGWDPGHRPWPEPEVGGYDTVLCTYVLNVILLPRDRARVLSDILTYLRPGGRAYVSVRRDLPRRGRQGRGVWQHWVERPAGVELVHLKSGAFEVWGLDKGTEIR